MKSLIAPPSQYVPASVSLAGVHMEPILTKTGIQFQFGNDMLQYRKKFILNITMA